jgi:hypothetical protein
MAATSAIGAPFAERGAEFLEIPVFAWHPLDGLAIAERWRAYPIG